MMLNEESLVKSITDDDKIHTCPNSSACVIICTANILPVLENQEVLKMSVFSNHYKPYLKTNHALEDLFR